MGATDLVVVPLLGLQNGLAKFAVVAVQQQLPRALGLDDDLAQRPVHAADLPPRHGGEQHLEQRPDHQNGHTAGDQAEDKNPRQIVDLVPGEVVHLVPDERGQKTQRQDRRQPDEQHHREESPALEKRGTTSSCNCSSSLCASTTHSDSLGGAALTSGRGVARAVASISLAAASTLRAAHAGLLLNGVELVQPVRQPGLVLTPFLLGLVLGSFQNGGGGPARFLVDGLGGFFLGLLRVPGSGLAPGRAPGWRRPARPCSGPRC